MIFVRKKSLLFFALMIVMILICTGCGSDSKGSVVIAEVTGLEAEACQGQAEFPDWRGYVDDTLAMNSMYSFDGYEDQGVLYLDVKEGVKSFDLFINNQKIDIENIKVATYEIDYSDIAVNGINTVQVTNIVPGDIEKAVTVSVPYPTLLEGTPEEVGISEKPLEMISNIVEADINNGFTSAQLAIIKDGKLVYNKAWGVTNSYDQTGSRIEEGVPVTTETMYDLASNTKMYAGAYAVQYLVDKGELSLDEKIVDILGSGFVDDTLEIRFANFGDDYPGLDKIKKWKSQITVKDIMMHQAGFPDSGHYHNKKFDTVNQYLSDDVDNILFVSDADKGKTLKEGIYRTPLMYEPGTATQYSDIDYMLLGLVIEKKTGKELNTFLKETFWQPLSLEHITYSPLKNGFTAYDCAATELNGNTRDGLIDFPGVRHETVQGEVHDEESYYMMEGESAHAGLFASAEDLAKLAYVMLSGGYENTYFFSKNTRDLFTSPQTGGLPSYGIGWWREADDRRVWYFGTQSSENTIGHQGWTGTLTMIDPDNDLVLVFLTNSINTPILDPTTIDNANRFSGAYYTTATLGFVPQILYMGMESEGADLDQGLESLMNDMITEKQKLVDAAAEANGGELPEDHPIVKALNALKEAAGIDKEV